LWVPIDRRSSNQTPRETVTHDPLSDFSDQVCGFGL
jgi:hypothetical protein